MELKHVNAQFGRLGEELLIVPYGIETIVLPKGSQRNFTFNRTLWN